jgi:hypothetical protein
VASSNLYSMIQEKSMIKYLAIFCLIHITKLHSFHFTFYFCWILLCYIWEISSIFWLKTNWPT